MNKDAIDQPTLFDVNPDGSIAWHEDPPRPSLTPKYAYRVTQTWPHKRKRTVPIATRQRVLSILAYQRDLWRQPAERAMTTIERIQIVGDWEDCTADFDVPQPSEEL